ncbi:MAG TPA: amidase [Dehalococcoidia bacterium]|nr:amidase [Dehalococcoidia bacterium]
MPMTIKDAGEALRSGKISSVELTTALLKKTKALNPTLGAFLTIMEDTAMTAAAEADAKFAAGTDLGPMQGIPYAIKDIIATKDAPTTGNSHVLDRKWGEGYDATVIAKLRAGGAVTMGKLVLNEFAIGMPYEGNGFPLPQNPWDLERSASGSSSGTGIAVSTGMVLGGLGTDTGGSTRGPSSFNGHTGMKQTFGRVSKFGCVPLGYSLDNINPMARSAYDCALMLGVMAGYDPKDPTTVDVPVPDYIAGLNGDVRGMRIGLPMPYFFDAPDLDPETRAAVLKAVDVLKDAGAIVKEVVIPHAAEAKAAMWLTMVSEAFSYHHDDLGSMYDTYGIYTSVNLTRGALFSGGDFVQAQRFRSYFKKAVAKVMADLDVLVTPTSVGPAPKRSEMSPEKQLVASSFTGHWNLTGLPAMATPCGFSSNGLPLSMQFIGKPFAEATVFKVGDAYQRLTNFHLQVPPIAAAVGVAA